MYIDGKARNIPSFETVYRRSVQLACLSIEIFFAWFTEICITRKIMINWQ